MPIRSATHVGCVVVFTLLLAACGKDDSAARGRDEVPVTVTTVQLRPVRWSDELTTLGTANARESVTISASVSETVQQVQFDSAGAASRASIGVVIVFGVAFSTLLSLFAVPAFYSLLARFTHSPEAVAHELTKLEAEIPPVSGHA